MNMNGCFELLGCKPKQCVYECVCDACTCLYLKVSVLHSHRAMLDYASGVHSIQPCGLLIDLTDQRQRGDVSRGVCDMSCYMNMSGKDL